MAAPLIPSLLDLFPETVTIEPCATEDAIGGRSYGAAVTVACRITQRVRQVRAETGEERVSTVQLLLAGDYGQTVTTKSRYTLPARFAPSAADVADVTLRQPVAVAVGYATDENGPHHQRVYF